MTAVPSTPAILRAPDPDRFSAPRRRREGAAPPEPALWLEATVDGRVHTFELRARRERAIVVGSVRSADVCIDDPRVALVEFHLERSGSRVFVVPAYGARLELNAVRVRRPEPIRNRAVIAFAGHVMRVRLLEAPPGLPYRLEPTVTAADPPSESPRSFGNDTIVTSLGVVDEAEADGDGSDSNTTLVFRPSAALKPAPERTTAETPAAKLVHELPTPRAAPLELSELLAIRAAAGARLPARRVRDDRTAWFAIATTLAGFALGFAAAHWLATDHGAQDEPPALRRAR